MERQILLYLQDHPAAADSAEGVRHWWLRDMGELSQTIVSDALGELLKQGWVITRGAIFALDERETGSIARFLEQTGEREDG